MNSISGLEVFNPACACVHCRILRAEGVCESVLYGLPLLIQPTTCWKLDWDEMETNHSLFQALCSSLKVHQQSNKMCQFACTERISNLFQHYSLDKDIRLRLAYFGHRSPWLAEEIGKYSTVNSKWVLILWVSFEFCTLCSAVQHDESVSVFPISRAETCSSCWRWSPHSRRQLKPVVGCARVMWCVSAAECLHLSLFASPGVCSHYILQPSACLSLLLKPVVSRELLLPCSLPAASKDPAPDALHTVQVGQELFAENRELSWFQGSKGGW